MGWLFVAYSASGVITAILLSKLSAAFQYNRSARVMEELTSNPISELMGSCDDREIFANWFSQQSSRKRKLLNNAVTTLNRIMKISLHEIFVRHSLEGKYLIDATKEAEQLVLASQSESQKSLMLLNTDKILNRLYDIGTELNGALAKVHIHFTNKQDSDFLMSELDRAKAIYREALQKFDLYYISDLSVLYNKIEKIQIPSESPQEIRNAKDVFNEFFGKANYLMNVEERLSKHLTKIKNELNSRGHSTRKKVADYVIEKTSKKDWGRNPDAWFESLQREVDTMKTSNS